MIRLLIADDQPVVRAGLSLLLEAEPDISVVGQASTGLEAVQQAELLGPDLVLMDVRMPELNGIEATRLLTADRPNTNDHLVKVLVLTTFQDDEVVYGALREGASGFLLKHAAPHDLVAAVRRVAAGDAWIDSTIASAVIRMLTAGPSPTGRAEPQLLLDRLTRREREVLTLMAHGLSNVEIADHLVLSQATVKTHVARVIMKTGSRDRTQAVVLAYRGGLVTPDDR